MLGCWDFNGKKGPYFKQNHRKCTNQGSEGGTKKKKQLGATAAGKYAAPNNPCLISPPKISRHREEIPS